MLATSLTILGAGVQHGLPQPVSPDQLIAFPSPFPFSSFMPLRAPEKTGGVEIRLSALDSTVRARSRLTEHKMLYSKCKQNVLQIA